ncbi:MAG: hypothetical protein ABJA87_05310 [bacterium]
MEQAKDLICSGLRAARAGVTISRPGVLVDERYGGAVVERAAPTLSFSPSRSSRASTTAMCVRTWWSG